LLLGGEAGDDGGGVAVVDANLILHLRPRQARLPGEAGQSTAAAKTKRTTAFPFLLVTTLLNPLISRAPVARSIPGANKRGGGATRARKVFVLGALIECVRREIKKS